MSATWLLKFEIFDENRLLNTRCIRIRENSSISDLTLQNDKNRLQKGMNIHDVAPDVSGEYDRRA